MEHARKARRARRLAVAVAGASVLGVVVALPGSGGANADLSGDDGVVTSGPTAQSAQDVRQYWTPKRMANATPMEADVGGVAPSATVSDDQTVGSAREIAGSPGTGGGGSAPAAAVAPDPVGYTYPFPFTRYNVDAAYTRPIYKAVGKMFFTQNGSNFVCSGATVVTSVAASVVYTAGHCVSDGSNTFSTNVLFAPARRSGANPFGTFPGTFLSTTSAWHNSNDFTRDLGAFRVGVNSSGQTLKSRTGMLGFSFNQSRVQHWNSFGYPAAAPFAGETMVTCQASHAVDDTGVPGSGPNPVGIGCDMTGGSSGGPWIRKMNAGSFISGVNSYKYTASQPGAMYSPHFDTTANTIRCSAADGGPPPC